MQNSAHSHGALQVAIVNHKERRNGRRNLARAACVALLLLGAIGCSGLDGEREERKTGIVNADFCQMVLDGKANDGRRLRVRASFGSGAEYVRLFDARCAKNSVFLKSARRDVDPTLCNSATLSKKYGCPVDAESGVRGTFTGTYHFVSKEVGRLEVEEIANVSREIR